MLGLTIGRGKFKRVAIVDVGSASAAASVMEIHKDSKSKVLAAHRSFIPYEKRSKEQFAARMGATIEEACGKVINDLSARKEKGGTQISDLYVFSGLRG